MILYMSEEGTPHRLIYYFMNQEVFRKSLLLHKRALCTSGRMFRLKRKPYVANSGERWHEQWMHRIKASLEWSKAELAPQETQSVRWNWCGEVLQEFSSLK